jgi:glycine cleavage system aminomethyltransferase T
MRRIIVTIGVHVHGDCIVFDYGSRRAVLYPGWGTRMRLLRWMQDHRRRYRVELLQECK